VHCLHYILNRNRTKEKKKNRTMNRYLHPLLKKTKNISQFFLRANLHIPNKSTWPIWLIDSIFIYLLLCTINQSRRQYSKIKVARTSSAVMAMCRNECAPVRPPCYLAPLYTSYVQREDWGCVRKHYPSAPGYHFILVVHRMLNRTQPERCHGPLLGDPWKRYSLCGHSKREHDLQSQCPRMFSEGNIYVSLII